MKEQFYWPIATNSAVHNDIRTRGKSNLNFDTIKTWGIPSGQERLTRVLIKSIKKNILSRATLTVGQIANIKDQITFDTIAGEVIKSETVAQNLKSLFLR